MDPNTTRPRKPFQYKADEDSDDSMPEALDEEEQESLINTLQTQNDTRNKQYKTAFTALCLLCTLPYLSAVYAPTTDATTALLSILALTSLLASAYTLYALPPHARTGLPLLDAWWARRQQQQQRNPQRNSRSATRLPQLGDRVDKSPLELYLPSLNLVLVALVAGMGVLSAGNNRGLGMWFAFLPAGVLGLVVVVQMEMASVDVGELESLRYGYKGA